jgi:hypothetical protein
MSKERFTRLIHDFCARCGITNANDIANGGSLMVHGVALSIVYSEKIDPLLVQIFCDMGECPTTKVAEAYAKLLQKNFYFKSVRGPAFTVDPTCGRILLIQDCELDMLTAERLIQRLSYVADEASLWHYLPPNVAQLGDASGRPAPTPAPLVLHSHLRQLARR